MPLLNTKCIVCSRHQVHQRHFAGWRVQTTLTSGGVPQEPEVLGGNCNWHKHLVKQDITNVSICAFRKVLGAHKTGRGRQHNMRNGDWECVKLVGMLKKKKKRNNAFLSSQTCTTTWALTCRFCSAGERSRILWEIHEDRLSGSTTPAKLSSLTVPLGLYTCSVIMRTSHEPSQEIVFSLKSPEQPFPLNHSCEFVSSGD